MSLYQCEICGSVENTALACQGVKGYPEKWFDWTGHEEKKGKKLCSACAPDKYSDGTPSKLGKWHNEFPRTLLPLGMFKTNGVGNLEHIETGDTDYHKYAIKGVTMPLPITLNPHETELSTCCGAPPVSETDLCADCLEHADFKAEEEEG